MSPKSVSVQCSRSISVGFKHADDGAIGIDQGGGKEQAGADNPAETADRSIEFTHELPPRKDECTGSDEENRLATTSVCGKAPVYITGPRG